MAKERTAAGFVVACEDDGTRRYLLLRNSRHGAWGFPKGHSEKGETLLQTALRETEEETGITSLTAVPGFECTDTYQVTTPKRGEYLKTVTYFLATTSHPSHVRSHEHSDSGWFALNDALEKLGFPKLQAMLKQADEHLNSHMHRT